MEYRCNLVCRCRWFPRSIAHGDAHPNLSKAMTMMKRIIMLSVIAASVLFNATVGATTILTIDVSDPSAVVFSATGANADANDTSFTSYNGIVLRQFLIADPALSPLVFPGTGTLTGGGSGQAYDRIVSSLFIFPHLSPRDLNLYSRFGSAAQTFSTAAPAFSGATTWDLSSLSGLLPSPGAAGDVFAGDEDGIGPVAIGQWATVPEPSTFAALTSLGWVGLCIAYRKRRRAKATD